MKGKKTMFLLRSVTHAYRARDLLEKNGIHSYIERVSSELRQDGCGYGVAVYENAQRAEMLLTNAGIKIRRIMR